MAELHRILGYKFHWPKERLQELESVICKYAMVVSPATRLDVVQEDLHNIVTDLQKAPKIVG